MKKVGGFKVCILELSSDMLMGRGHLKIFDSNLTYAKLELCQPNAFESAYDTVNIGGKLNSVRDKEYYNLYEIFKGNGMIAEVDLASTLIS